MELVIYYIVGVFLVMLVVLFTLIWATTLHPNAVQDEPVVSSSDAPLVKAGQVLKIMSWNIQYMAGKKYFFWYDLNDGSGPDERPSPADMADTLKAAANIIMDEDPDIILLQEIDDGAKRTGYVDQLSDLLTCLPKAYCCHASAFYWKASFVPHPRIMGAVGMKLSTIAKYRINKARRHQLAVLPTGPITRQFHLKRAILETRLPLTDGNQLVILNTHLETFDEGATVRQRQVSQILSLLKHLNQEGFSWVLGGDFNLVPSERAYHRLMESEKLSYQPKTEISTIYQLYKGVPSLDQVNGSDRKKWFTHFSNKPYITTPDRTVDYIFISNNIQLGTHYVRQKDTLRISDHFPVVAEVQIP
ncbi:MAG: endonuclease/exonuclease/phosphatase family protein [Desulfobacterales bacterium]|nr:MAG: endonuclease/exonuclease/phosphatase family protein [Desulfobacterales bacterium]